MFRNYLTIAIRNILRQKGYSFINIIGLAIGLACAILILLWVKFEFSYDDPHEKVERIYRLGQTQYYSTGPLHVFAMPAPLAADIKGAFPEIEDAFRYTFSGKIVRYEEKKFSEQIIYGDKELFSVFTVDIIEGNSTTVYDDFSSVVISEKIAKKYFGDESAIGKVLIFNDTKSLKVTAVFKELPKNSSLRFDICIPFEHLEDDRGISLTEYGWNSFAIYVLLADGMKMEDVNTKIKNYFQIIREDPETTTTLWLWPLKKIHLYRYSGGGMINTIYMFILVAAFILLIACINFMNLATARSTIRSKEIGLRKVMGAERKHIINQFIGESVLTSFLSLLFAILIVSVVLPSFNLMTGKELTFNFADPIIISGLFILTLFTGFIAGSYPALYLSSFSPIKVLKGFVNKGKSGANFRRVLVVFQFTLSIVLIIGTIIIFKQLKYLQEKDIGFEKENVVSILMRGEVNSKFSTIKPLLLQNPKIEFVSRSNNLPYMVGSNTGGMNWDGKSEEEDILIGITFVDNEFDKVLGMEMAEGRFFEEGYGTDSTAVVLNENAVKVMGLENPIGKWVDWGEDNRFHITGVVKDYNFESLSQEISPLAIFNNENNGRFLLMKINKSNTQETIDFIEKTWNELFPTYPFAYTFLEDGYREMYAEEEQIGSLFKYFAILAILISNLGLFGLASYLAEQKTKEIGIRKVLGSSIGGIVMIMSKEFIKWIIVANIIAWPLTWFLGTKLLDMYAYRTEMSIVIFLAATLASFAIAFITISYQAIKAGKSNPIDALRYE